MSVDPRLSRRPLTWVQVLNYNGLHCLGNCLASLEGANPPAGRIRLVVVDNGSEDGSLDLVHEDFPRIEVIRSDRNLGFAGGNNLGLRKALAAGADYAVLVNMDAQVAPDCLVKLVGAAADNSRAALVGARICTEDGERVEFDGGQFDPVLTAGGYSDALRAEQPDRGPVPAAYACGAGMLMRLEALKQIGLFTETFFAYHEDVELALRARLFGFEVLNVPDALVFHIRGGAGAGVGFRDFMGTRNLLLTLMKIYDRAAWHRNHQALTDHFLGGTYPQRAQALLASLFKAPTMLRQRRRVQDQADRTYSQILNQLDSAD